MDYDDIPTRDSYYTYYIVYIALTAIWVLPLFILWVISLCLARRKGDPARHGVTWLKITFPVFILALILQTASVTLYFAYFVFANDRYSYRYTYSSDDLLRMFYFPATRLGGVAGFFTWISDSLLIVTLVALGTGFLIASGRKAPGTGKLFLYVAAGVATLLAILALAQVAFEESFVLDEFDEAKYETMTSREIREFELELRKKARRNIELIVAIHILYWIASLPVVVYASYAVHKAKVNSLLRNAVGIYLAAAVLTSIRFLARFILLVLMELQRRLTPRQVQEAWYVAYPIINYLLGFVVLVLLFTIAVRNLRGLWSTAAAATPVTALPPAGFAPQGIPQAIPQGYQYYAPPQAGAPMAGQQQQPYPAPPQQYAPYPQQYPTEQKQATNGY